MAIEDTPRNHRSPGWRRFDRGTGALIAACAVLLTVPFLAIAEEHSRSAPLANARPPSVNSSRNARYASDDSGLRIKLDSGVELFFPSKGNSANGIRTRFEVNFDLEPAGFTLLSYWYDPPGDYEGSLLHLVSHRDGLIKTFNARASDVILTRRRDRMTLMNALLSRGPDWGENGPEERCTVCVFDLKNGRAREIYSWDTQLDGTVRTLGPARYQRRGDRLLITIPVTNTETGPRAETEEVRFTLDPYDY